MNKIATIAMSVIVIILAVPLILMSAILTAAILAVGVVLGGDITTERIEQKEDGTTNVLRQHYIRGRLDRVEREVV